jgi:hypothetical protein
VVYLYEENRIIETRDGSRNLVQQLIHGTQDIDELVMMRTAGTGDLYVHHGERSERELAATRASTNACPGPATCPEKMSTMRMTGGANWNVIALADLGRRVVFVNDNLMPLS